MAFTLALLLVCYLGSCAAFPSYMTGGARHAGKVHETVKTVEGDILNLERQEAVGDAKLFYNKWERSDDNGQLNLNAMIPCPVIASIYGKFAPDDFELKSAGVKLTESDITACTAPNTAACDKLFSSYIEKDILINKVMVGKGGAALDSASGIHSAVPWCSDDTNPDDKTPCGAGAPNDAVPIFKLHSYRKAIHGSSTQIRYDRESKKPGYRAKQFFKIWEQADANNDGQINEAEFADAIENVFVKNTKEDSSIYQIHAQAVFMSIAISYTEADGNVDIVNDIQTDLKSMYEGKYVAPRAVFKAWGKAGVMFGALKNEISTWPDKVKKGLAKAKGFFCDIIGSFW